MSAYIKIWLSAITGLILCFGVLSGENVPGKPDVATKNIEGLILKLNHAEFETREKAKTKLIAIGAKAHTALLAVRNSEKSEEVRVPVFTSLSYS